MGEHLAPKWPVKKGDCWSWGPLKRQVHINFVEGESLFLFFEHLVTSSYKLLKLIWIQIFLDHFHNQESIIMVLQTFHGHFLNILSFLP